MPIENQLTEFNPALIYSFEPESTPQFHSQTEQPIDTFANAYNQIKDTKHAYLFAQNNVLPRLRRQGLQPGDEAYLLSIIKALHRLIGKTVLNFSHAKAGEYTKNCIYRWHNTMPVYFEIMAYLSKIATKYSSDAQLIHFLNEHYRLDSTAGLRFLQLLRRFKARDDIPIHPSEKTLIEQMPAEMIPYCNALGRLYTAYHQQQLSDEDKETIDKIVLFGMPPEKIESAMQRFATDTIEAYNRCDPADLEAVSQFIATTYYRFTDIHPFVNGNGRTGTVLINLLLRTFDLPSIMLRHAGDKGDEKSEYSLAIAEINTSRDKLQALILKRLLEAQRATDSNPAEKAKFEIMKAYQKNLRHLKRIKPDFDPEIINGQFIMPSARYMELCHQLGATEVAHYLLSSCSESLARAIKVTEQTKRLDTLRLNLNILTCLCDWKILIKQNKLIVWHRIADFEQAQALLEKLNQTNIVSAQLRLYKKQFIIHCELNARSGIQKLSDYINQTIGSKSQPTSATSSSSPQERFKFKYGFLFNRPEKTNPYPDELVVFPSFTP